MSDDVANVALDVEAPESTNSNKIETDFADESVKAYDFEYYEGRKNVTDRISILSSKVIGARIHYKEGYFICQSEWKLVGDATDRSRMVESCVKQAMCCEILGDPVKKFAVPVLIYATATNGEMTKPVSFMLKVWRFRDDKYILLRATNKEFPLDKHDLVITCSEPKYQKMAIQGSMKCYRLQEGWPSTWKAETEAWVKAILPKIPKVAFGKELSPSDMAQRLGKGAPSVTTADQPAVDLKDILN